MKHTNPTAIAKAASSSRGHDKEIILTEARPDILKTMEIYLRAMDDQELCQTIELAKIILNEQSG